MTQLTGTGLLIRLTLRRDRLMLPLWILALLATVGATVSAFARLYPDQAARNGFALSIQSNAVFRAFYGPLYSAAGNGGLTAWRTGTIGVVILGLMSIFLVTRHTRQEEETGRLELVGAAMVGRFAPLVAVLSVAAAANLVAAVLCVAMLIGDGQDAVGSVVFGLSLGAGGSVFAGIAAVAAQVAETARATNGLAMSALGAAFLVRAIGDSGSGRTSWLSWLSPIGWAAQSQSFAANRLWVIVLMVAVAVAVALGAVGLNAGRDLGGSLFRTRTGPASATRSLAGPLSLVWRQQRGALLGWAAGFVVFAAVFGSLAGSIAGLVDGSPQIAEVLRQLGGPGALVDGYFGTALGIIAPAAAGFSISAVLRLRSDETAIRVEPVLATGVSRLRLIGAHAVAVFVTPAVLMLLAGLTMGIAANTALGGDHLATVLAGALVQIPAVWVIGAVAVLLFGLAPRWSGVGWGVLALCALLAEVGPVLNLPQAALDVSPFTAVPRVVANAGVPVTPLVVLLVVGVGLTAIGVGGFRRRDIG